MPSFNSITEFLGKKQVYLLIEILRGINRRAHQEIIGSGNFSPFVLISDIITIAETFIPNMLR